MSGEDLPALRHPARANLDLVQNGSTPDVPATPEGGTGPGGLPS